jgi:hypothetical protein
MSRDSSWFQHGSPLEKTVRHGQRFVVYGNIKDTPVPPTLPHIQVWSITRKGAYVSKWAVGVSDTETTGCQTYENRDHRGRVTFDSLCRVKLWFAEGRPPGLYFIKLQCCWLENGVHRSAPSRDSAHVLLVDDSPESKELEEKEREYQAKHGPDRFLRPAANTSKEMVRYGGTHSTASEGQDIESVSGRS